MKKVIKYVFNFLHDKILLNTLYVVHSLLYIYKDYNIQFLERKKIFTQANVGPRQGKSL